MKMNLKIISLLLILFLFSIASVSATDSSNITDGGLEINNDEKNTISNEDNTINSNTFTDLKKWIDSQESGSTIYLDRDYEHDDDFKENEIRLNKTLTIEGNNHSLDGKNRVRILYIHANDVVLKNITFKNGYSSESIGALGCKGSNLTIINCNFINNHANGSSAGNNDAVGIVGGAVYILGNECKIVNNTFINNIVGGSGGGLAIDGKNHLIENNTFIGNKALRHMNGGALQLGQGANAIIRGNTFKDNHAGMGGGAIELQHSMGDVIENNIFINNSADYGGALSIYNTSYFTLRNNNFSDNFANGELGLGGVLRIYLINFSTTSVVSENIIKNSIASVTGGAFYIFGSNIEITKNLFLNNTAAEKAGGIINALGNDITISNNEIINNSANAHGGAIYIDGNGTTITSNKFINSNAKSGGGAIYSKGKYISITDNNFTNSISGAHSGAIYVEGDFALISNNNLVNNVATSFGGATSVKGSNANITSNNFSYSIAGAHSGAVYIDGNFALISNNNLINNTATSFGGAIFVKGSNVNIFKNNFTSNRAGNTSNGGAIRITGNSAKITENTFNRNSAGKGSDILIWESSNSKISSNIFADYKDDSLVYYGSDIIVQDNGGIFEKTNLIVSTMTYSINEKVKSLTATLKTAKGNAIMGKTIYFKVNGKTYSATTNSRGQATVNLKLSKVGNYNCVVKFNEDNYNKASSKTVKLKVTKQATKLTAQNKSFKKYAKNKKIVIKLKTSTNKVLKKKKITLKVNGKTYKATTNSKGKATIKIKLTKKGTFKAAIKFAGDNVYGTSKKTIKIKIK